MDLVAACRAFVAVSGSGSFTVGAASARIPQSVASRRVAALEEHYGARLFDRSSRSVTLTTVGREVLPTAKRLVELADTMSYDAERAKLRPFRFAVPHECSARSLGALVALARGLGLTLEPRPAGPMERAELVRTQDVQAALVAVPPSEGEWTVPLGLAASSAARTSAVYLESLRPSRVDGEASPRRVWLQPEDDVPHVRDRLTRLRDTLGLRPTQVSVAATLVAATAAVLDSADLLLCSEGQSTELGLHWRPMGELRPARGYAVAASQHEAAERIRELPTDMIARCLAAVRGEPR